MDGAKCDGYKDGDAPTVCVEGGRASGGSHKRVHDKFDKALEKKKKAGRISGATMSMVDAIDVAVESHADAFPASGCRESCIRAQLEDYYDRLCPGAPVNAKTQNGDYVGEENAGY